MKEYLDLIMQWGPLGLLGVLAILGILLSLAGSVSLEERKHNGEDDDHYVLRQPLGRVGKPLLLLIIGAVIVFCTSFLSRFLENPAWLLPVIRAALAVIFGLVFWKELAKVVRQRVYVNGDKIRVTPAFGPAVETTFAQIRTVANKVVGGDGGVVGKKIKTKEGTRFEVINTMSGYDRFCVQLDEKVELPNLTKKLFKKKDKEPVAAEGWDETQETMPLPEATVVEGARPEAAVAEGVVPEAAAADMTDVHAAFPEASEAVEGILPEATAAAEGAEAAENVIEEVQKEEV